jgi:hypothetical protein
MDSSGFSGTSTFISEGLALCLSMLLLTLLMIFRSKSAALTDQSTAKHWDDDNHPLDHINITYRYFIKNNLAFRFRFNYLYPPDKKLYFILRTQMEIRTITLFS